MFRSPTRSTSITNLSDILDIQFDMFLFKMHFLCKGGMWFPRGRCQWSSFFQHLIDLFERETFGFGDEEKGKDE